MPLKRKKSQKGEGAKEILQGVNKFLKKHKVLSKGAKLVAPLSGKHANKVRVAGKVAASLGYGLAPAGGGGLRLAGQGQKLTIPMLKSRLKARGLKVGGNKSQLMARLAAPTAKDYRKKK